MSLNFAHTTLSVMPGLVPGIHALLCAKEGVDGRVKPTAVRFNFSGRGAWHGFFCVFDVLPTIKTRKEATPCGIRISFFTVC
jgi:hypothetical protein